jgi:hypothetical protein
VANIENMTQWSGELVDVKKTSKGPVGVGTTFIGVVKLLGRKMENTHEITRYEPNSRLAFKITSGPAQGEAEFAFGSAADGTKVSIAFDADMGGFFRVAEPIVARATQRQWETNLANLKDLLEASA